MERREREEESSCISLLAFLSFEAATASCRDGEMVQCGAVQCSAVQYSAVWCSAVQCSVVGD